MNILENRRIFMFVAWYIIYGVSGGGNDDFYNRIICSVHDASNQRLYPDAVDDGWNATVRFPRTAKSFQNKYSIPLKLDGEMSVEEVLYLVYLNIANNLKYGQNQLEVHDNVLWRRRVINLIAKIAKKRCPYENYIPEGYINVIRELFMHYMDHLYHSTLDGASESKDGSTIYKSSEEAFETWKPFIKQLETCANSVQKLELSGSSDNIQSMDKKLNISIKPPEEDADIVQKFQRKDDIIDVMWWLFSLSYGTCYRNFEGHTEHLPSKYLELFEKDFLVDMRKRWVSAGQYSKGFGSIFGPFDNKLVQRNLRYCVTAAYTRESIEHLQLTRPLAFHFDNAKTGNHLP